MNGGIQDEERKNHEKSFCRRGERDALRFRSVIENTMESRIGKVCGKDEIRAFVKAELAKMNDATSDYSFRWSFNN